MKQPILDFDSSWNTVVAGDYAQAVTRYLDESRLQPLFILGDALEVLQQFPDGCIDCAMTSPPYWGKREYANGGIGLEDHYQEYIRALAGIFSELQRVLKPEGSFWLNIGDSYLEKNLVGIPWRLALTLIDLRPTRRRW